MLIIRSILFSFSFLLLASVSFGSFIFSPSLSYLEQTVEDNNNAKVDTKMTLLDLRLGYIFESGLYVGGLYSVHDNEILSDASDSYFGPSIGYFYNGLLLAGTYYLYGERDLTNGTTKYSSVNGFQVDLSYAIKVTDIFYLGPQITYHSVKFTDSQVAGISSPTNYKWRGLSPYFNMTFIFE